MAHFRRPQPLQKTAVMRIAQCPFYLAHDILLIRIEVGQG
jgi:hypothetical protein